MSNGVRGPADIGAVRRGVGKGEASLDPTVLDRLIQAALAAGRFDAQEREAVRPLLAEARGVVSQGGTSPAGRATLAHHTACASELVARLELSPV